MCTLQAMDPDEVMLFESPGKKLCFGWNTGESSILLCDFETFNVPSDDDFRMSRGVVLWCCDDARFSTCHIDLTGASSPKSIANAEIPERKGARDIAVPPFEVARV